METSSPNGRVNAADLPTADLPNCQVDDSGPQCRMVSLDQPMNILPYQQAFHWIRTVCLDAPTARLSIDRVHRACGVAPRVCGQVLEDLVRARFLVRASDHEYLRYRNDDCGRLRESCEGDPALERHHGF